MICYNDKLLSQTAFVDIQLVLLQHVSTEDAIVVGTSIHETPLQATANSSFDGMEVEITKPYPLESKDKPTMTNSVNVQGDASEDQITQQLRNQRRIWNIIKNRGKNTTIY